MWQRVLPAGSKPAGECLIAQFHKGIAHRPTSIVIGASKSSYKVVQMQSLCRLPGVASWRYGAEGVLGTLSEPRGEGGDRGEGNKGGEPGRAGARAVTRGGDDRVLAVTALIGLLAPLRLQDVGWTRLSVNRCVRVPAWSDATLAVALAIDLRLNTGGCREIFTW